MADYRLSAQMIGRSEGRSAIAAAAYRAGVALSDERVGLAHDYTRKTGVLHTEIMAPEDGPEWVHDREALWNRVERSEKRPDAQVAREIQLSLPHEISHEQRVALVREFVQENFVAKGMIADIALHAPPREGDQRNHHAHIMLTTRPLSAKGFENKNRAWNSREILGHWREAWAENQNRNLRQILGQQAPQVSHKSNLERGIEQVPGQHLGPAATGLQRRHAASRRGELHRATQTINQRIKEVREAQDKIIDRVPKEEKTLRQIAMEMSMLKDRFAKQKEEHVKELADVLKEMRTKRGYTLAVIDRLSLEPFEKKERDAQRELAAAQQQAQVAVTPKAIMRWFTDPAGSLWAAAKKSMQTDAAAGRLVRVQTTKDGFKQWLESDAGKDFTKAQIKNLTNNSVEIEAAVEKIRRVEREKGRAKTWLNSDDGVKYKIDKVRELQGDLSQLRTKERRARRNVAQLDRNLKAVVRSEKIATGLANAEIGRGLLMPERILDTTKYVRGVQIGLSDMVKKLTPQQKLSLSRVLTLGLGIGRGD